MKCYTFYSRKINMKDKEKIMLFGIGIVFF